MSWRTRADPRRIVVFDIDNQTGMDSLGVVARQLSDSLRVRLAKRLGVQVVGDTAVRATTGVNERRLAGTRVGAGAIVAGSISRARGDSVTLRLSVRDMSEDQTFPTFEMRLARRAPLEAVGNLVDRLTTDLEKVNWGPKGLPPAAQ